MEVDKFSDTVPSDVKRMIGNYDHHTPTIERYHTAYPASWLGIVAGIGVALGAPVAGDVAPALGAFIAIGSFVWQLSLRKSYREALSEQGRISQQLVAKGWFYSGTTLLATRQ